MRSWPRRDGAALPDVPAIDESGVSGLYVAYWHGMWAPKGTPKDIIAKLNAAVVSALADPNVKQRLADQGTTSGRASSRRRRRWPPTTGPRPRNGGRSSGVEAQGGVRPVAASQTAEAGMSDSQRE